MNLLLEKGIILEKECGNNFSYILNDNNSFESIDYKVLQSPENNHFVKCMKMLNNGKVQLYYQTKELKSFLNMLSMINEDVFFIIVENLLEAVIKVKNNGFLCSENIDISLKRIFINPATYKVSFIYLPLKEKNFDDYGVFENEIRTSLIKVISEKLRFSSGRIVQFRSYLSNGTLSLEDLYRLIKEGKGKQIQTEPQIPKKLRLISMDEAQYLELKVNKDEFVIGRNPAVVDGVISFNRLIGRVHCKIYKKGNQYQVMDMKSTNGTYINDIKLEINQLYSIKNGDCLRLANSKFKIVIE